MRAIRSAVQRTADRINRRYGGIIDRIRRRFVVELCVRTVRELSEDDVTHMAAGVAYYALFSIFPLLLGMISVLGFFLESGDVQERIVSFTSGFLPGSEQLIESNIDAILGFRSALGFFSLVGLLWSGSAMFGALNRAINRAWDIHTDRPIYIGKPRQLLMAVSVGILFALSVSSAAVVRTAGDLSKFDVPVLRLLVDTGGQVLLQAFSLCLVILIFLVMYKFMPNTKTYWKYIWPGAITGAGTVRNRQEPVHPVPGALVVLPERVRLDRPGDRAAALGVREQPDHSAGSGDLLRVRAYEAQRRARRPQTPPKRGSQRSALSGAVNSGYWQGVRCWRFPSNPAPTQRSRSAIQTRQAVLLSGQTSKVLGVKRDDPATR